MKNFINRFILYLFSFKYIYTQIISLSFKRIISSDIDESNFYDNYAINNVYTNITIGNPTQKIKAQIKMSQYSLCIKNTTSYKPISSLSYKQNGNEFSSYNLDYSKSIPSNESFIIGNYDKTINDLKFLLTTESKYELDGIIGLQIRESNEKTYGYNLISQLKSKKLINKEVFFFNYDQNKDSGELIIGDYPHFLEKFKNKYQKEQIETTGIHIPNLDMYYDIVFRSVLWDGKEVENNIIGKIDIEIGYIIGTKYFEDSCYKFFEKHIINKKCAKKIVNGEYNAYICDDYNELNISSFPELKFYNSDINCSLILTYEDLFIKKNGKIYFMVVFNKNGYNVLWTLGNLLIKRNMIVFDIDRRVIGIYDKNRSKDIQIQEKYDITAYIIVISVFGFIILCLFLFIIYKFILKQRTKKAYELKEDYEYNTKIND